VIFSCRHCRSLLEAPVQKRGRSGICPACFNPVDIPWDAIEKNLPAEVGDTWFAFRCPSCDREVFAAKETVGRHAVCPHCLGVLDVPNWGHYPDQQPLARVADPLASLSATREITCVKCAKRIPANVQVCPFCGANPEARPV
jgi:hypothetical protein